MYINRTFFCVVVCAVEDMLELREYVNKMRSEDYNGALSQH
jgi:hypothetical protein